ncbi:Uncharacterised protein [Escherichia coli]|nr:hypothetical protein EC13107_198c00130 [Escherichia coli]OAC28879.1 hypothetical protein EC3234A_223c00090 [Escherichia coli]SQK33663.1 Uncharacterised protein [Escherichia coli]SQM19084.1 Uncharacterised protein [Escherichia coli]SQM35130.1 Uncharacterised protein [Escherichia coli]
MQGRLAKKVEALFQGVPPHYFNFCTNNDQEGGTPGITAFNTVQNPNRLSALNDDAVGASI